MWNCLSGIRRCDTKENPRHWVGGVVEIMHVASYGSKAIFASTSLAIHLKRRLDLYRQSRDQRVSDSPAARAGFPYRQPSNRRPDSVWNAISIASPTLGPNSCPPTSIDGSLHPRSMP